MNRVVLTSVIGGLANGRNFNRYISTAVAVRPLESSGFLRRRSDGVLGAFQWRTRMMMSTGSTGETTPLAEKEQKKESSNDNGSVVVSSYWGIQRPKIKREDGTEWPWNCFKPWETYEADLSIDLSKHHVPKTFLDKTAFRTVKSLRVLSDLYFQEARIRWLRCVSRVRYAGGYDTLWTRTDTQWIRIRVNGYGQQQNDTRI